METFSALLTFCVGNSPLPVNSPHKGQWRGALVFSLICARIKNWVNSREAGDLIRHRGHYDISVMKSAPYPRDVRHTGQSVMSINTLRPRQHGRHFADDTFKHISLNENVAISIKISLKFVHKGQINNIPALVQIMAWRRSGDKP